jgi:hypothetical protein
MMGMSAYLWGIFGATETSFERPIAVFSEDGGAPSETTATFAVASAAMDVPATPSSSAACDDSAAAAREVFDVPFAAPAAGLGFRAL